MNTETDSQGYPLRPMGQTQWDKLADRMGAAAQQAIDAAAGHRAPEPQEEDYWWTQEAPPEDYDPNEDPWANPQGWEMTPERPTRPDVACGRCGGTEAEYQKDPMHHLRWECTAQDAWIEAAINDRKARPDRYRQALKDRKARA